MNTGVTPDTLLTFVTVIHSLTCGSAYYCPDDADHQGAAIEHLVYRHTLFTGTSCLQAHLVYRHTLLW